MSEALVRDYLKSIERTYKDGIATEHTYRADLANLLQSLKSNIVATNEPKRSQCGAPDYVISRREPYGLLTIGYVEAKDIGKPLSEVENDEQLKRYRRALDNLILTDYLEFRWYVNGEPRLSARLGSPGLKKGTIATESDGPRKVSELLTAFLDSHPEPIANPHDLAKRMAKITHMIRDIVVQEFTPNVTSNILQGLYGTFTKLLIKDLSISDFADMFAQTLAYGLFAARYNHTGSMPFKRTDASREIPRTNPFLRSLFGIITGPDIEYEPFVGFVDDLAQLLAHTNMSEVLRDFGKRTRQEDPVVHFYETFLAAYDPKLRELRGVYYTPEPVVSYIVRSVDHILKTSFECLGGLADTSPTTYTYMTEQGEQTAKSSRVLILDPACGTGTFLYSVIDHIRETYRQSNNAGMWSGYVKEHLLPRIFGFELLMAPYAMAHLKLGMQLAAMDLPETDRDKWAYHFDSDERLGVFLTNSLERAVAESEEKMGLFISNEANAASLVKRDYPVMVVLGNPPYSGHSANKGQWITRLLHGQELLTGEEKDENFAKTTSYFEIDGQPLGERNPKWLNDDYVKFIRFAQWRIEQTGHGILAFISNHGYIDNPTFRGMRQSLMRSFDAIYILDLHGNSKKRERSPDGSKDENVFDIQQGVAIGIFVRKPGNHIRHAAVHHAHLYGEREKKYAWLSEQDINTTEWTHVTPDQPFYLFTPQNIDLRAEYQEGWKITEAMPVNVLGFQTHRDQFAIAFDQQTIRQRIEDLRRSTLSDSDIAEKYGLGDSSDWQIVQARSRLRNDPEWMTHFQRCLYRPFDWRYCYFDEVTMDRPRKELKQHVENKDNLAILAIRQMSDGVPYSHFLPTRIINIDRVFSSARGAASTFPLYLYPNGHLLPGMEEYDAGPGGRRPNFAKAFIDDIRTHINLQFAPDGKGDLTTTFGPEDIFDYMYAIFHAPEYRSRYAEFLKIDFPRLPLTSDIELFRELCSLGAQLVGYHLMELAGPQQPSYPESGNNVVETPRYTEPSAIWPQGRVWINRTQYFEGITRDVWEFHIGGYQVCQKWLKDRKSRRLTHDDIQHYQRIIANLTETIMIMERIDEVIEEHGGWPVG